jgi:hypothetical protein
MLLGYSSLSEKGENLSDALTASFVTSASVSTCTVYMATFCSSGQSGTASTASATVNNRHNRNDDDDDEICQGVVGLFVKPFLPQLPHSLFKGRPLFLVPGGLYLSVNFITYPS